MEQGTWDFLITAGVLIGLGLVIWARVSGMTIPELIRSIKDIFSSGTSSAEELTTEAMTWRE